MTRNDCEAVCESCEYVISGYDVELMLEDEMYCDCLCIPVKEVKKCSGWDHEAKVRGEVIV